MKNIEIHGSKGAIKSFAFSSTTISLPEVFGGSIPPALTEVNNLSLRCPFPLKNTRLSLSLANSLCGPALNSLEIDFTSMQIHPDYATLTKLLKDMPVSSPKLERLTLRLPNPYLREGRRISPCPRFQALLDDQDFTFPLLKEVTYLTDLPRNGLLIEGILPATFRDSSTTLSRWNKQRLSR
ncbi:hypothetical protein BT96DRAFT_459378 [Gymnopus androsaceus JB14]|uniref:F-box domain-containing protein n=1 Tax=Gymnopus androsaceus JB14 TaxID=1447944 RepID=A0A6A4IJT9_9AGAR|nr:hypothetical protein BT96DRAFT_459378 [Gymnopus androsaceus JB14]